MMPTPPLPEAVAIAAIGSRSEYTGIGTSKKYGQLSHRKACFLRLISINFATFPMSLNIVINWLCRLKTLNLRSWAMPLLELAAPSALPFPSRLILPPLLARHIKFEYGYTGLHCYGLSQEP